jgi:hypothetical protein
MLETEESRSAAFDASDSESVDDGASSSVAADDLSGGAGSSTRVPKRPRLGNVNCAEATLQKRVFLF